MKIIPSILVQSEDEFKIQITAAENVLEMVQLDIADGKFVPNTTWADPDVVEKQTDLDIELHLMVEKPLQELKRWSATEQIKRVLIHYESVKNLEDIMPTLHAYGWEIGIVLNPDTPIDVLEPYISEIKAVMFMGVVPGFQGQTLIPEVLTKIKKFKSLHPTIFTEIDGAVNEETLPEIIASGVDAICPGSAIFGNDRTVEKNVERMQDIINKLT
ncbi:hypothetical protein HN481_02065 [Candidatus Parcubacteria bacterium]|jgi:ribulose-phosphate 3-epimerase|nr:hypothetical protein [Candidatus Parcubacteria bacterium]